MMPGRMFETMHPVSGVGWVVASVALLVAAALLVFFVYYELKQRNGAEGGAGSPAGRIFGLVALALAMFVVGWTLSGGMAFEQNFARGMWGVIEKSKLDAEKAGDALSENALSPEEFGETLSVLYGCRGCHSIDGSPLVGPSWKGVWGEELEMPDGTEIIVGEEFLREAIVDPGAFVEDEYPNVMPKFSLSEKEVDALIAYIKTLE